MRLAFVVSHACSQTFGCPEICPKHTSATSVAQKLARAGFDFNVAVCRSGYDGFEHQLNERGVGPKDVVILYVSCDVQLSCEGENGEVVLRLDKTTNVSGEPVNGNELSSGAGIRSDLCESDVAHCHGVELVRVDELVSAIAQRGVSSAAIVLDLTRSSAQDAVACDGYVERIRCLFESEFPVYCLICGVSEGKADNAVCDLPDASDEPLVLTRAWMEAMDSVEARNELGVVLASRVIEVLGQNVDLQAAMQRRIASFSFVEGRRDVKLFATSSAALTRQSSRYWSGLASGLASDQPLSQKEASVQGDGLTGVLRGAQLISLGDELLAQSDWQGAADTYKKALMLHDDEAHRVTAYVRLGAMKAHERQYRQAELMFRKALEIAPEHVSAMQHLVAVLREQKEFRAAGNMQLRLLGSVSDRDQLFDCLMAAAADFGKGHDIEGEIDALERARELRAIDVTMLTQLAQAYERALRWDKAIDILVTLAEQKTNGSERAVALVLAAQYAQKQANQSEVALGIFCRALDIDPSTPRAFEAVVQHWVDRGDYGALDAAMTTQIERVLGVGNKEAAAQLWRELARLRQQHGGGLSSVIEALDQSLSCEASDVDTRVKLAELLIAQGHREQGIKSLEIAAFYGPRQVDIYAKLYRIFVEDGEIDRAFLASAALVSLGDEQGDGQTEYASEGLFYDQYRSDSLVSPKCSLDADGWQMLYPEGFHPYVARVLGAVAECATDYRLAWLESEQLLPELDAASRLDPATSTVSVARAFGWVSKVLALPSAKLYIVDDVPSGIAAIASRQPTAAIGKAALSGKTLRQLAFMVGRAATYFHPNHYILVLYPTLQELTELFLAATVVVKSDQVVPASAKAQVEKLSSYFKQHLTDEQRYRLERAIDDLLRNVGRVDLVQWAQGVEIASLRAGLLVCGDITVAQQLLEGDDQTIGGITCEQCFEDLLAFSVTEGFSQLRARLAIAVG